MRYLSKIALCLAVILMLGGVARADVTTNPSRLVISENARAGEVRVHNSGRHTLRIETGWSAIIQAADGVLHPVPQGAPDALTQDLHLWPDTFTLKPGESRDVYLVLDPKSVLEGERQVHLRINADRVNGKGPRWGLTLPVFIRAPGLGVSARIIDVRPASKQSIFVLLRREEGLTPYGKLVVTDGRGNILGELGNITLYAQDRDIRYEIPLDTLPSGAAFVSYIGSGEFENQVFDVQGF
jgi:hypothetical protein